MKWGETVDRATKDKRFKELDALHKTYQTQGLQEMVNQSVQVLVERKSGKNPRHFTGHTTCHKIVNFEADEHLIGTIINVKITETKSNGLFGVVAQ